MKAWKVSIKDCLKIRETDNPSRLARMAVDVLLPYEELQGKALFFKDLVKGISLREILNTFNGIDNVSSTSKVNYIKAFNLLVNFLINDPTSPERSADDTPDSKIRRGFYIKDVEHEVENCIR